MDEKNTNLEQLRIHELRDLARKMGVNAPTLKKKEQLIDEIMGIMNGESVPEGPPNKKGRPVRSNSDNFDVVDLILPSQHEMNSLQEYSPYDDEQEKYQFMVNSDYAEYGYDPDPNMVYERQGLIEIKQGGFGVVHVGGCFTSYKDVFVNKIMVKQHKLRSGMLVKVKSRRVKENYPEIAFEIAVVGEYSDVNFDESSANTLNRQIVVNTQDLQSIKLGGRYFVNPGKESYMATADIYNAIKKNSDIDVEILFLNAMIERIPYGEVDNYTYIDFSKQDEDFIIGTSLFFEKIKRKAETGKDVVVIINEISQFAKSYNNLYLKSNTYSEISNVTAFRTKQLLSNAKNTDCGSITIIAVDKLRVPMNIENLFKFEILPLFDN